MALNIKWTRYRNIILSVSKSKSNESTCRRQYVISTKIQDRLVAALGTKDRGIKHQDLYVTRENTMPAVLTELAFVDNKSDADKIATPKQRQAAAEAIYQGILDYYEAKGNNVSSFR